MGRGWTGIPYKFCGLQRCFAPIQLVFRADVTENLVIRPKFTPSGLGKANEPGGCRRFLGAQSYALADSMHLRWGMILI